MNTPSVAQALLARFDELVGSELEDVEAIFQDELKSRHDSVRDVYAHVSRFRGKRLRPILLLLSARVTGRITHEHKVLAAVVEMIHTATLVHDDVLDEAATRRHVATVNSRWNNETSVLFGDFLFTHAFHLASSLSSTLACRLIGQATNVVCEGELCQIHQRGNLDLDEDTYLEIIGAKTAELCALCCFLGAHFAGADQAVCRSLKDYGRLLGMAFQIADDVLDLVGNEQTAGKSLGTDFHKQKLTLPLIRLLDQAKEPQRSRIRQWLSQPNERTRQELQPLLDETGAIDYATGRAVQFAAEARACLDCVADSPGKRMLDEIAEFAVRREF